MCQLRVCRVNATPIAAAMPASSPSARKSKRKEPLPTTLREAGGAVVGGGFLVPSVMEAQERERQAFIVRQRKREHAERERRRVAQQVGGIGSSAGGPAGGFADWAPEYEVVLESDKAAARALGTGASPTKPATAKSMESSTAATTALSATPAKSTATSSRQASPRSAAPGSPRRGGGGGGASPRPQRLSAVAFSGFEFGGGGSGHTDAPAEFKLPPSERAKLQQMLVEDEQRKAAAAAELDLAGTVHPGQGHRAALSALLVHARKREQAA